MKKNLLAIGTIVLSTMLHAQCGKNVTWMSSKTEYLDSSGQVEDAKAMATSLQTTANHITVTVEEGGGDILQGDIRDLTCEWKEAYKNGRSHFSALMAKSNGETREATFTIEAKDGKIVIIVEVERMQGRKMRILIDNYKEDA